jgi:hypothetical protein
VLLLVLLFLFLLGFDRRGADLANCSTFVINESGVEGVEGLQEFSNKDEALVEVDSTLVLESSDAEEDEEWLNVGEDICFLEGVDWMLVVTSTFGADFAAFDRAFACLFGFGGAFAFWAWTAPGFARASVAMLVRIDHVVGGVRLEMEARLLQKVLIKTRWGLISWGKVKKAVIIEVQSGLLKRRQTRYILEDRAEVIRAFAKGGRSQVSFFRRNPIHLDPRCRKVIFSACASKHSTGIRLLSRQPVRY